MVDKKSENDDESKRRKENGHGVDLTVEKEAT